MYVHECIHVFRSPGVFMCMNRNIMEWKYIKLVSKCNCSCKIFGVRGAENTANKYSTKAAKLIQLNVFHSRDFEPEITLKQRRE